MQFIMISAGEVLLNHAPYLLDHFAVGVGAISGVLAARGRNVDLFGVLVLALVAALGGGTVRDLVTGELPVTWIRDPSFIGTAATAGVLTFFLVRITALPANLLLIADAFALALFTMSGAKRALSLDVAPPIAIVLIVMTGVAGGIARDVLIGEIPLVFRPQIYLYATAVMLGAIVSVVLSKILPNPEAGALIGAAVTLFLRLAAIRWKIRLPVFRLKSEAE